MKKKTKLFIRSIITKVILISVALSVLLLVYLIKVQSNIDETVPFSLDSGTSVSSVAHTLKESGKINSENLFKISVMILGGRIQSGEYDLQRGASVWRIAKKFSRGDVASTIVIIPEGLTIKQIKSLLSGTVTLTGETECAKPLDNADVCNLKEGDLFPDTYRIARGTSRLAVLELSRKKMESIRLGWEHSGRAMPKPLKSWNEVITLASIVQKETPKISEMPIVASVYLNRLRKKMRLQADPTVVYAITDGLGDMQGRGLFTGHLKTKSPYNTYLNYGLPPAPIANVGREAISAVLNPADTNYLFFVADGQGGHKFARTYAEHEKNRASWREIKKIINSQK